ncbi:MAG TPA: TVP38/TMEM64 family protein, partial [Chromatiaceae bacterium]|nr:TVP38/TMEM64 family protein [Chromatiaceae bacterium]
MRVGARFWLILALAAGGILLLSHHEHFEAEALAAWMDAAGPAGPLLFMAVYALTTVLLLPGAIMTLAGGALYGPFWGTLFNLTGSTIGAGLAFLIARYLAADWVQARNRGLLERLVRGVEAEGWRFVAFVRLVPLFPFFLMNYALGVTRIRLLPYLLTTAICMAPPAFAFTWL